MPLPDRYDAMVMALDQPAGRPSVVRVTFVYAFPGVQATGFADDVHPIRGTLTLNHSYAYRTPLNVDDFGISDRLSQAGQWHEGFIPWGAVQTIVTQDGRAMLFHVNKLTAQDEPRAPTTKKQGHLRVAEKGE